MNHAQDSDSIRTEDVVVANMHRRFTGVSRSIAELIPHQRRLRGITLIDSGGLDIGRTVSFWSVFRCGWRAPCSGKFRVFHARRDVEMVAGLVLRSMPGQRWKVIFTSAAPKVPNRFLTFLINRMDGVIATSERSAGYLPWFTRVIGHGVDTDAFCPAADQEKALGEVGLQGRCVIGAFGRVRPSKGTDVLIEALVDVLGKHQDVVCVVSGLIQKRDTEFYHEMVATIARAGLSDRILFLGDQRDGDIKRWYQRISICVAASRVEGYGLTPFEAFASGATAVTSHAGVWPKAITSDIGVLFETGDATSLANALDELLSDRQKLAKLSGAARKAALERFSIAKEVAAIEDVYQRLQRGERLERQYS